MFQIIIEESALNMHFSVLTVKPLEMLLIKELPKIAASISLVRHSKN